MEVLCYVDKQYEETGRRILTGQYNSLGNSRKVISRTPEISMTYSIALLLCSVLLKSGTPQLIHFDGSRTYQY